MITKLNKNLKIAVLLAGLACSGAAQAGIANRTTRLAVHLLPWATNKIIVNRTTRLAVHLLPWTTNKIIEAYLPKKLAQIQYPISFATNNFPQVLFGFKDEQMKIAAGNPTKIKFEIKDFCGQAVLATLVSLGYLKNSSSNIMNLFYGLSGRDSLLVLVGRHIAQQRHAEKLEK